MMLVIILVGAVTLNYCFFEGSDPVKLTIDHTKISSSLIDFPILVHLGKTSGINHADTSTIFTALGSDANRKKISVTDANGKELYVEIEKWDTASKRAWLWIKVPTISNTTDTVLYLKYDINRMDNTAYVGDIGSAPAQNVWDNGFLAVFHMNDIGSVVKDSTRKAHNGTKRGGTPDPVMGEIGPSALFTGSNYIEIPDNDDFSLVNTRHLIINTWFSPSQLVMPTDDSEGSVRLISKSDSSNHEWSLNYYNDGSQRDQGIAFYFFNHKGGLGTGVYMWPYGDPRNNIGVNEWEHLTGKGDEDPAWVNDRDGNYAWRSHWVSSYKNGQHLGGQTLDATVVINPKNGNAPVLLGYSNYVSSWLIGRLDEVRFESAPRSDAWIKATHYSESDKLITFASIKCVNSS